MQYFSLLYQVLKKYFVIHINFFCQLSTELKIDLLSTKTSPEFGFKIPIIMSINVLLPDPLSPPMPTKEFLFTIKFTFSKICSVLLGYLKDIFLI